MGVPASGHDFRHCWRPGPPARFIPWVAGTLPDPAGLHVSPRSTYDTERMPALAPSVPSVLLPGAVLVVDDHDLVRLGLRTLLQSYAGAAGSTLEVIEARTLQAALAALRARGETIAVVLLDLHLPDAHGLAGLEAMLAEFPAVRVVVLSGSTDPVLRRRALELGATTYLSKSAFRGLRSCRAQFVVSRPRSGASADTARNLPTSLCISLITQRRKAHRGDRDGSRCHRDAHVDRPVHDPAGTRPGVMNSPQLDGRDGRHRASAASFRHGHATFIPRTRSGLRSRGRPLSERHGGRRPAPR